MADFSGLAALQKRPKPPKSKQDVNWRARYFGEDKTIYIASIRKIYKDGFTLSAKQGVPVGALLNIEFIVNYREKPTRVRFKGEVTYSFLPSGESATQLDVKVTKISKGHLHIVNNLLQLMMNDPSSNLRV